MLPKDVRPLPSSTAPEGFDRWRLTYLARTGSTNDLARSLAAWHAVRAGEQTAARGRFGRAFAAGKGGLWLSAVLPAEGGAAKWLGFSLVAGWALLRMLDRLGVAHARLRWPNDLMSGSRKLGGLLIEQQTRDLLTVGVGINVHNAPWREDPALKASATRLADLLEAPPELHDLAAAVLDALANAQASMRNHGLAEAVKDLNARWSDRRPVEISLSDGTILKGAFGGVDAGGNPRIFDDLGGEAVIPHHQVTRLTEPEPSPDA